MQLPTAIPILLALGVRIFIILINPNHTPTTTDHILVGLWQGVALYHTLKHIPSLVLPVGIGIAGKLLYDFSNTLDTTKCACVLLGVASGVLVTDILAQLFEHGRYNEVEREPITPSSPHRPSKRLRLVSFERTTHKEKKERPSRHKAEAERARAQAASPAPTNAYSVDTAITLDSLPSSIDPDNSMSPAEREVAMLRARASLADSERRRFKEERKWALSQGNTARAEQLGWQVKRYSALMESYHREADAKVVEAAQAARQPPPQPSRVIQTSGSRHVQTYLQQPAVVVQPQPQAGPSHNGPLVSVTVGGQAPRSRRKSGGASAFKPAIYVHGREGTRRS